MLNFIKNLFKKKEIVSEEVRLEELYEWFSGKIKEEIAEINASIREEMQKIADEKGLLEQNLNLLDKAKPDQKLKILPKVKQTVEGHRGNYIRRIRLFLSRIEIPKNIDYIGAQAYCRIISDELDHIAKTTLKSYYATQHLFYKELEEVSNSLKSLAAAVSRINKITTGQRIRDLGTIKKDIKEIEKGKTITAEIKEEIEDIRNKEKSLAILKGQTDKKLNEIKDGEDYKSYNRLSVKMKELDDKKRLEESKLFNLFSPLDAALKKYERIAMEGRAVVSDYLAYPLKALFADKDLKILDIFENVKKNIENSSIELKDKKKIKTLEAIKRITKDELRNFIREYRTIEDDINEIKVDLKDAEKVVKEEKRMKDRLVRLGDDIRLVSMKEASLNDRLRDMDFEKTKRDVISGIREMFNIKLTIT